MQEFRQKVHEDTRRSKDASVGLLLKRVDYNNANRFWGKAFRNNVTGTVYLKDISNFPDFLLVDLWARKSLHGTLNEFIGDKYLFRTVPLNYRTWIYHDLFRTKSYGLIFRKELMRHILSQRCIDAPVRAGRWSPILLHAPAAMFVCLAGDLVSMLVQNVAVAMLCLLSNAMNNADAYRYTRTVSLPIRTGILIFLLIRFQMPAFTANPIQLLGFLVSVLLVMLDMLLGDGGQLFHHRFTCHYEVCYDLPVVDSLANVFVCRRHGAAHLEEVFGDRGNVDQCVTGMGTWGSTYALIADVQGLLVELRPVKQKEWEAMVMQYYTSQKEPSYLAIDACSNCLR